MVPNAHCDMACCGGKAAAGQIARKAVGLSNGCSAWWPRVGSRSGTSWSSSPHAAAPGLTAAALRACYRAKLRLRRPRDKAIWATRDQEQAPTCPGRGILGQILPNLRISWGGARLLA